MIGSAKFSDCRKYRYSLGRLWNDPQACQSLVVWIMLNPSTATHEVMDPTIRRCVGFSQKWGHDGLVVVNLFALRSTDPSELEKHYHAASRQEENDRAILLECAGRRTIAAWGSHKMVRGRDSHVFNLLKQANPDQPIECLGVTASGHPRHPLYVKGDTDPVEFKVKT